MDSMTKNSIKWIDIGSSVTSPTENKTRKEVLINIEYDEQIQFISEQGGELSNVNYKLSLDNGKTISGKTDANGKTQRIVTEQARNITKAELNASDQSCCSQDQTSEKVTIALNNIITNPIGIGSSVKQVETTKSRTRGLTVGEIEMAKLVFADSVDYSKVKVHNGGYWLFFGFQDENTAVTPNGEMYFPGNHFKEDFSILKNDLQAWFMHEMTHVWQYQLGYPIKWVRGPRPNMTYDYTLSPDRKLCDYNMEAQGNILADYFLTVFKNDQQHIANDKYADTLDFKDQIKSTLSGFLENPKDKGNLPKTTK